MHIGNSKAIILKSVLQKQIQLPQSNIYCLELGSYCGYSAVTLAMTLEESSYPGMIVCVESELQCVKWTRKLCELANLDTKVHIIHGNLDDDDDDGATLCKLREFLAHSGGKFSLVLLDHDKSSYLKDLRRLESADILNHGCAVVADNVLSFGRPMVDYLEHVRHSQGLYASSEMKKAFLEYSCPSAVAVGYNAHVDEDIPVEFIDGVEISILK